MEIFTYRIETFVPSPTVERRLPDLTGFEVEATDGSIGKVDEASYEQGSSCLVVDTGHWIFGKKRMIPAGVVRRVDPDSKTIYVAMTKDEIKSAPDYDQAKHEVDEKGYHKEVGDYYEPHVL